jgi:ribose-phosphate pyrophosphokinase
MPDDIAVVINSTACPATKSYFDLWGLVRPLSKRKPRRLIAVMPFMGFRRQERDQSGGEAVMSELMADFLACAGATDVVLVDIHHPDTIKHFENAGMKVYHIDPDPLFIDVLRGRRLANWVFLQPDSGRHESCERMAKELQMTLAKTAKLHPEHEETTIENFEGDVKGKHVLCKDDEIATAGTLTVNADLLERLGALDLTQMATHGVLSANAVHRIEDRPFIKKVYITDSIYLPWEKRDDSKIQVLSLAPMIANTILNICEE